MLWIAYLSKQRIFLKFVFPLILIPSLSWGLTFKDGKQLEVEENTSPNSISCPSTNISTYEESTSHEHSDIKISDHFAPAIVSYLPRYESWTNGTEIEYLQEGFSSTEMKLIADFNNDGLDDIMIEYFMVDTPPVFLISNGDGTFTVEKKFTNDASRRQIRKASAADLNNDGWVDIVGFTTTDPLEKLGWVRGEPDILLINQQGKGFKEVLIPEWFKNDWNHGGNLADIDNDGLVDILPVSEEPDRKTGPLINKGDNKHILAPYPYSKLVTNESSSSLMTGDLNNDGYVDLVFSISRGRQIGFTEKTRNKSSIQIIFGDGDFDFRDNLTLELGSHWISSQKLIELQENEHLFEEAGRQDLPGSELSKNKSRVDGGTSNVELVDLNNDGLLDILAGYWLAVNPLQMSSGFKAYINEGECFSDQTNLFFPNQRMNRELNPNHQTAYIQDFFFEDITGDNLPDLVLQFDGTMGYSDSSEKYSPHIFVNNGNNQYLPVLKKNAPNSPTPSYQKFNNKLNVDMHTLGDFDGNGKADLVYVKKEFYGSKMYVLLQRSQEEIKKEEELFQKKISELQGRYPIEIFLNNESKEIIAIAELSIVRDMSIIQNVEFLNDEYKFAQLKGTRGYLDRDGSIEIWAKQPTVSGYGECLYFKGDIFNDFELENQQFDTGMPGINHCRKKENIWPISLRLISNTDNVSNEGKQDSDLQEENITNDENLTEPEAYKLQLTWATVLDGEYVVEAEDTLTYTIDNQKNPQVLSIKDIEYQNMTTDSETHGRENLKIELLENEMISIKGRIQIFPDEFIDLDILEEIKKEEVTIPFSKSDEIVISW